MARELSQEEMRLAPQAAADLIHQEAVMMGWRKETRVLWWYSKNYLRIGGEDWMRINFSSDDQATHTVDVRPLEGEDAGFGHQNRFFVESRYPWGDVSVVEHDQATDRYELLTYFRPPEEV